MVRSKSNLGDFLFIFLLFTYLFLVGVRGWGLLETCQMCPKVSDWGQDEFLKWTMILGWLPSCFFQGSVNIRWAPGPQVIKSNGLIKRTWTNVLNSTQVGHA